MPTDKKITDLPISSSLKSSDVSIVVDGETDYQYSFTSLIQFLESNLDVGVNISFGTILPQATQGKNGDIFVNTVSGSFAQKVSGTWTIAYTLPTTNAGDGTLLYGAGMPGTATGKDSDSYIDTLSGIFYKKSGSTWNQAFSLASGPTGPRGNSVLYGTVDPDNSIGSNGDFFINTSSWFIFGPKAYGIWPSGTIIKGSNGNTLLNGTTNPSNSLGNNGDYYINNTTLSISGPKIGGVWPSGISLTGVGLPAGGASAQVLVKVNGTDFNTAWQDFSFANITGQPSGNTNLATSLNGLQNSISSEATSRASADTILQNSLTVEVMRAEAVEATKVDKVAGLGLSSNDYTTAEKTKLASLTKHYQGKYTSLSALQSNVPNGPDGDYAIIASSPNDEEYIWDSDHSSWVVTTNIPASSFALLGGSPSDNSALNAVLQAESSARVIQDATLSTNITNEAAIRATADLALGQLTVINALIFG